MILEGQDKLTAIGDPPVPGEMALEQAWTMSVQSYFPLKNSLAEENEDRELGDISEYAEPKVDAMRMQKDDELARYRKEAEIKKKLENQKKNRKVVDKKLIVINKKVAQQQQ
jgi:dynein light intermediate chain 2